MSLNLWNGRWRGLTPEGDAHRRARNVITPTGGNFRGKFPSRKNGRMVHHEGMLELDAIYLFECSPRIIQYREQPETIRYPDEAKLRQYTPDFELVLATGEQIYVEVKPVSSLQHQKVQHKLSCVAEHMRRSDKIFIILTDAVIRQEPRLSNLCWLYHRTPRVPPTADAIRVAINSYQDCFPLSVPAASALLQANGLDPYSLLLAGQLRCSLEQPISDDTLIDIELEVGNGWFFIAQEYGF
jgi:hypothetical protein